VRISNFSMIPLFQQTKRTGTWQCAVRVALALAHAFLTMQDCPAIFEGALPTHQSQATVSILVEAHNIRSTTFSRCFCLVKSHPIKHSHHTEMSSSTAFDNRWHSSSPAESTAFVVRLVISYVAVGARTYYKIGRDKKNLYWDDLLIILALISSTIGPAVVLWGKHLEHI
jgi:hypothetical protein